MKNRQTEAKLTTFYNKKTLLHSCCVNVFNALATKSRSVKKEKYQKSHISYNCLQKVLTKFVCRVKFRLKRVQVFQFGIELKLLMSTYKGHRKTPINYKELLFNLYPVNVWVIVKL